MNRETFLVIGSNSFSGSNFINFLLNQNMRVIGISRSNEKNTLNPYKYNKNVKNFKFYKLDINKNTSSIIKIIKKFRPKYIINFAAQGMVNESWNNPEHWYQTNLVSMTILVQKLIKFRFIKLFLNFSTPEVYGNTKNLTKEKNIFSPSTPYAISRAAFDTHLINLYKFYKFPIILTRTSNVFGPYQDLYRVVPKTILSILKKKKVQIHGRGETLRSFILINDVSKALFKIIKNGKIGESYHISTKEFVTIKQLCKLIVKKVKIKSSYLYTKDRIGKDFAYKLDSTKLNSNLNWKPEFDLSGSLDFTIDWYLKNFDKLKSKKLTYEHKK